jgi:hypothetical protein
LRRHLPILLSRFAKFSRDRKPRGSLPAFASDNVAIRIPTITVGRSLPASPLHDLAAWLPQGSNAGLPRSTCVTEWVRSLLLYRRPFRPRRVRMEHPFQPQPRSLTASLTPSFLTILERGSHQLTLPLTLAPIRLDAGRNILPSRFRCPSCDGGIHCPRASRRVVTESPYLVGYCQRDGRSGRVVLAGQSHMQLRVATIRKIHPQGLGTDETSVDPGMRASPPLSLIWR